ncbi:TPA_asm: hypothetical protein GJE81_24220, partial [Salmonella enterica subsp. enterica serovar Enteritidis]|nr:hypothetical protein [Salmonella enterica subsp. enterica serovar Enteritidis]
REQLQLFPSLCSHFLMETGIVGTGIFHRNNKAGQKCINVIQRAAQMLLPDLNGCYWVISFHGNTQ